MEVVLIVEPAVFPLSLWMGNMTTDAGRIGSGLEKSALMLLVPSL